MPPLVRPGDPGLDRPLTIDGITFDIMPSELDASPDPISDYHDMLDGGAKEVQRRPGFDGVANHADRWTFGVPYDALKEQNRIDMSLIRVSGGIHKLTLWRMEPVTYTLIAGVTRYYFPRFRKCAAWLYYGLQIPGGIFVDTVQFETLATIDDAAKVVTYAEGPSLISPGAGGIVIARQPDPSGPALDYTGFVLGDNPNGGEKLVIWSCWTHEVSMRAPQIRMRGITESQTHTFVEV